MSSKMVEFTLSSSVLYILLALSSMGIAGYSYSRFTAAYTSTSYLSLSSMAESLTYISQGGYVTINLQSLPAGSSIGLSNGVLWFRCPLMHTSLPLQYLRGEFNISYPGIYNFSVVNGVVEVMKIG
jgi:hypothetical protein